MLQVTGEMKIEISFRGALARAGRISMFAAALSQVFAAGLGAQDFGAQGRASNQAPPTNVQNQGPKTPHAAAPKDLTGYWVAEVTELWRYRMIVPDKNDYQYVPLNPEGRKVAAVWDPAKDEASGNACKSFGAPAIMQVPGRIHIYWQDENTLRMDIDSGTQTRLFHFGGSAPQTEGLTWQGFSVASWEGAENIDTRDGQGGPIQDDAGRLIPGRPLRQADFLKVVTTHLRPGYLQKNGIPYSGNAILEEDFDTFPDPYSNTTWLTVASVVTDPQYLIEPAFMHAHFKKVADNSGWDPTTCHANEPR
jgi:hypothetical protein